jgi:hypothetical protein
MYGSRTELRVLHVLLVLLYGFRVNTVFAMLCDAWQSWAAKHLEPITPAAHPYLNCDMIVGTAH